MLPTASRLFAYRNVGFRRDPENIMLRDVNKEDHKHFDMTGICDLDSPETQICES